MNRTKTSTVREKPIDDSINVSYPNIDNMEKTDSEISDVLEKINDPPATTATAATTPGTTAAAAAAAVTPSKNPIETGGSS